MVRKKRTGRPPLPKREKRRHVIPFKLDDGELKELKRCTRKLGMSRSDVIRKALSQLCGMGASLSKGVGRRGPS